MLNPEHHSQHEQIKRAYAEVLYKWNLLNKRAELLKHTDSTGVQRGAIGITCSFSQEINYLFKFVSKIQYRKSVFVLLRQCFFCNTLI